MKFISQETSVPTLIGMFAIGTYLAVLLGINSVAMKLTTEFHQSELQNLNIALSNKEQNFAGVIKTKPPKNENAIKQIDAEDADFNEDGVVDVHDVWAFSKIINKSLDGEISYEKAYSAFDLKKDRTLDVKDWVLLVEYFTSTEELQEIFYDKDGSGYVDKEDVQITASQIQYMIDYEMYGTMEDLNTDGAVNSADWKVFVAFARENMPEEVVYDVNTHNGSGVDVYDLVEVEHRIQDAIDYGVYILRVDFNADGVTDSSDWGMLVAYLKANNHEEIVYDISGLDGFKADDVQEAGYYIQDAIDYGVYILRVDFNADGVTDSSDWGMILSFARENMPEEVVYDVNTHNGSGVDVYDLVEVEHRIQDAIDYGVYILRVDFNADGVTDSSDWGMLVAYLKANNHEEIVYDISGLDGFKADDVQEAGYYIQDAIDYGVYILRVDFNADGVTDSSDWGMLVAYLKANNHEEIVYDINRDGQVNSQDVYTIETTIDRLVERIVYSVRFDFNADGQIDSADWDTFVEFTNQHMFAEIRITNTTVNTGWDNPDTPQDESQAGMFEIEFDVTAFRDCYISTTKSGFGYHLENASGTELFIPVLAAAIESTADVYSTGTYVVQEADTETFTLSISYSPQEEGFYKAVLDSVNYGIYSNSPYDYVHIVNPETDFETDFLNLIIFSGNPADPEPGALPTDPTSDM